MIDIFLVYPFLQRFAFRLTADPIRAEDLAHDAVVRILERQDQFDGVNLQGWAGKVMFNLFIDQKIRAKRWYSGDAKPLIDGLIALGDQEQVTYANQLTRLVDRLPAHQAAAIKLLMEGYTYEEISEKIDIPIGTVRSRVSRGRKDLTGI